MSYKHTIDKLQNKQASATPPLNAAALAGRTPLRGNPMREFFKRYSWILMVALGGAFLAFYYKTPVPLITTGVCAYAFVVLAIRAMRGR